MKQPGLMISIEGADKVGKTTQINNIMNYLGEHNIAAETLKFPQYDSFFGTEITKYLTGEYGDIMNLPPNWVMCMYALDRQIAQPKINSWLADGKWVIFDRYTYSNIFSVAKHKPSEWDDKINYLEELEFNQMRIIKPDMNIYLHAAPEISYGKRNEAHDDYQKGKADKHESNFDLLSNTIKAYQHIATKNPNNWTIIDEMRADGTQINAAEVWNLLRPILDKLIREHRGK